jgi:hypothetical protein
MLPALLIYLGPAARLRPPMERISRPAQCAAQHPTSSACSVLAVRLAQLGIHTNGLYF